MDMNKQSIKTIQAVGGMVTAFAVAIIIAPITYANSTMEGADAAYGEGTPTSLFGIGGTVSDIINIMLYVIGLLSVIMIIVGGLRYVISGGNATAVSAAKNTVLYAIVGLIIAFLAYAIIQFVLGALGGDLSGGTNV